LTTENLTPRTAWQDARNACKTIEDRTALGKVIAAGWSPEEVHEFARVCFFRTGKDQPTPKSYREAIHKIAGDIDWRERSDTFKGLSRRWRKEFHQHGSVPIPPRDPSALKRRDQYPIDVGSFDWPYHTPEHRSAIEQFARERFSIAPDRKVTPRQWEYARELWVASEGHH
jgi:hypothetical protein